MKSDIHDDESWRISRGDTDFNNDWNGRFRILSLDGGGLRGAFGAAFLAAIEKETGQPIRRFFDLITGTSTGAILACGLSLDIPAKDILSLYKQLGPRVFGHPRSRIMSLVRGPKHDPGLLYDHLKDAFSDDGKEYLVRDAKTRLCVAGTWARDMTPRVFKTPHDSSIFIDPDRPMWSIAAASASAPGFLPPFSFSALGGEQGDENENCVDGGLWANNPAFVGVIEAIRLGARPSQVELLSLSTGSRNISLDPARIRKWGFAHWGIGIFEYVSSAQSASINFMLRQLGLRRYRREDIDLSDSHQAMDSPGVVEPLAEKGWKMGMLASKSLARTFLDTPAPDFVPATGRRRGSGSPG